MTPFTFISSTTRVLLLAVLVLLLCLAGQSHAIHEDEQGKFDWMLRFLGNVEHAAVPSEKNYTHMFLASSEGGIGRVGVIGAEGGKLHSRAFVDSTPRCLLLGSDHLFVLSEDGVISAFHKVTLVKYRSVQLQLQPGERISSASCLLESESSTQASVFAVISHSLTNTVKFLMYEFYTNERERAVYPPSSIPLMEPPSNLKRAFMTPNYIVVNTGEMCTIYSRSTFQVRETHEGECRNFLGGRFITHYGSLIHARTVGSTATPTPFETWRCENCDVHFTMQRNHLVTMSSYPLGDDFILRVDRRQYRVEGLGRGTVLHTFSFDAAPVFLVKGENGNLALITSEGYQLWTRYEGLAFPKGTSIVERPGAPDHFRFAKDLLVFSSSGSIFSLPAHKQGKVVHQLADVGKTIISLLGAPSMKEVEVVEMREIGHGQARAVCRYDHQQAVVSITLHGSNTADVKVEKLDPHTLIATLSFTVLDNYSVIPVEPSHQQMAEEELFVFTVNVSSGRLNGYMVKGEKAIPTWNVQLPSPIVAQASAANPPNVFFHNNLRLFPNKTKEGETVFEVRRRYPTLNTMAVAYYEKEEGSAISTLVVTVIDTITGSIHGTSRHANVEGSIKMILAENAVLYYFLDASKMRYCMGVWELLEVEDGPPVLRDTGVSPVFALASFFQKGKQAFSSLASRPPMVKVHVIGVFGGPVAALGLTTSFQSISRKNVVLAFESGRVALVELNSLLHGRPIFFKAEEEKIARRQGTQMLISPLSYPTHRYRIAYPKLLSVSPTGLESSNHLLVAGLDLFYVRYSSGKAFDLLNSDFDKQLLVLLVGGIIIACLAARFFVKEKLVRLAWA